MAVDADHEKSSTSSTALESSKETIPAVKVDAKQTHAAMRNFYVIAGGYLLFTLTDSAIRMIVLFELYKRSFQALNIAIMFTLYELAGVFTNLLGGIAGSKWGLRFCLLLGLLFQLVGIGMLMGLQDSWEKYTIIIYITCAQAFSGVAKDLVKMAGKSITKLVVPDSPEANSRLFKLVAWLTGSKNGIKGIGYFLGAALITFATFVVSLVVLEIALFFVTIPAYFWLDRDLGVSNSKKKLTLKSILNKGYDVNVLSCARLFLFGARDLWFEVALPVFLRGELGWDYIPTGSFLAVWIIIYGFVQSNPQPFLRLARQYPVTSGRPLVVWTIILFAITSGLAIGLTFVKPVNDYVGTTVLLVAGLFLFAIVFAINSSIHSFLILAYTNKDKVAMNVGFYYMANAFGRLSGTLLSGYFYEYYGLYVCLWASVGFLVVCTVISVFLRPIRSSEE